jgi:hypothetical protein
MRESGAEPGGLFFPNHWKNKQQAFPGLQKQKTQT